MDWRKSSYSNATGGDCLETASTSSLVLVRDTTDRGGVTLSVTGAAWTAFLVTLR
jgi:Domain of unknown function (DUF397)